MPEVGTEFDRGFLAAVDSNSRTLADMHQGQVTAQDRNRELSQYLRHVQAHNRRLREIIAFQTVVIALLFVSVLAYWFFPELLMTGGHPTPTTPQVRVAQIWRNRWVSGYPDEFEVLSVNRFDATVKDSRGKEHQIRLTEFDTCELIGVRG